MKKIIISLLAAIMLAAFSVPAVYADAIWEPQDSDFYTQHAGECEYVNDTYLTKNSVSGYSSPIDDTALYTIEAGQEIYVEITYTDESGVLWGVYQPTGKDPTGFIRLSELDKVYDSNDFIDDHKSELTPYGKLLDDFATKTGTILWSYPNSGVILQTYDASTNVAQWGNPDDHLYTDEGGNRWCYMPYIEAFTGWICIDNPTNTDLIAPTKAPDDILVVQPISVPDQPTQEPKPTDALTIQPINAPVTNFSWAIIAVIAVVLISSVLIFVFYRAKKK